MILLGAPGSGKSELLLRLIQRDFMLVADDQIDIGDDTMARPPPPLAGLLEVRGLGILRLPYLDAARLVLAVRLQQPDGSPRMPQPQRLACPDLPLVCLDPRRPSAVEFVSLALACALGQVRQMSGAFAA